MRLIDADALMNECADCQKTDPNFEERGWASHFINDAGESSTEWYCVEDMIENALTIDAIPVEWMNKQCEMADDRGDMEMTDAISWLIQTWQEEQEAR